MNFYPNSQKKHPHRPLRRLWLREFLHNTAEAFCTSFVRRLHKPYRLLIVAVVTLVAFIVISEVGHLNDYDSDEEKISGLVKIISDTGAWGMAVYVLIQILQPTFKLILILKRQHSKNNTNDKNSYPNVNSPPAERYYASAA